SLILVALIVGSTNVGTICATLAQGWVSPTAPLLALLACAFAAFIEMGTMPFDGAEAEQEIQDGPLTEYSGSGFAMVKLGI
ncbi:NADH-quinone oxidoreductase subunit H, partial [Proteus mirabilis]|uniref:NADH-quinone oxidoreductase subunit H n=1 Tax=Proteus mirabilis TaxID=584 RepID=UPI002578C5D8